MTRLRWAWLAAGVALAIALLLPLWVTNPYFIHILIVVAVFSIRALGVRLMLLMGHSNFGQAGFMAIGVYTSDILASSVVGMGVWPSMLAGALAACAVGALIGYPALRVKGIYFAILTLALGSAVRQLVLLNPFELTGAPRQFSLGITPPEPIGLLGLTADFGGKVGNYYLALGLLVITLAAMYRLDRSRVGLLLRSFSQSDLLAQSLGVNVALLKVFAFAISCFFAGLAGAFYSHYLLYADADLFGLWQSVYLVIYVVMGGTRYLMGPVVGSFLLIVLVELLRGLPYVPEDSASAIQAIVYAALLILMIFLLPRGLLSLGEVLRSHLPRVQDESAVGRAKLEASR